MARQSKNNWRSVVSEKKAREVNATLDLLGGIDPLLSLHNGADEDEDSDIGETELRDSPPFDGLEDFLG